jgi:NAD(P)-dependent dehydrogenase (short-subunit alcohol dehydrogenase family)
VVGNSDGIGLALTKRLLTTGWTVVGLSRSASEIDDDRYTHRVADVSAPGYPDVLAECLDALGGGPELCVYAAGIGELIDIADLSPQTRVLDVNLLGAARTVDVVAPRMVAARHGHLIGLSSLADVSISGAAPGYAASKAGLSTYLQSLALALREHGVDVTTVRFGFVDTKMAVSPVKPMMVSAEKAVDVLVEAMRTRRAVVSYPRTMAVAARLLRAVTAAQVRRR